jgi:hypothetical protein
MTKPVFALEYLLFAVYLVFFVWLVTKTKFFLASGLSKSQLSILFLLKVITGIFYGWIGLYYGGLAEMSDTWMYHYSGLTEYRILGNNPHEYFTNIFNNPYENGVENFLGSSNSYWNDLKGNVFTKLISIFHIFSFGHYYVNVIFFSYISFFGPMAFYRVMQDAFPGKNIPVLLASFLVPSFIYWSSGIHKEGLIFLAIGLVIYHLYFGNKEKKYGIKRISGILLGFLLLLLLRNFMLLVTVPAVIAWIAANKWPRKGLLCFAVVYTVFSILFFTLRYVDHRLDFPQAVVDKQKVFMSLVSGNSTVPIKELKPNVISFVKKIPEAVTLSALRPYPGDVRHLLSLASALEVCLLLILLVIFLVWRQKKTLSARNLVYFCIFFSFSVLLSIGFSVNNLGAICRYRSVVLPLLVVLMAVSIDWEKFFRFSSLHFLANSNLNKSVKKT